MTDRFATASIDSRIDSSTSGFRSMSSRLRRPSWKRGREIRSGRSFYPSAYASRRQRERLNLGDIWV